MSALPPFPDQSYWTEAQIVAVLRRVGAWALRTEQERVETTTVQDLAAGRRTYVPGMITHYIGGEVVNPDVYQWATAYLEQTS